MNGHDDGHDARGAPQAAAAFARAARRAASCATFGVVGAAIACAGSAPVMPPRLYDLTIETGMPHLDENLRYATTRERRCVRGEDLARLFPILGHVALQDCELALVAADEHGASYALRCAGGHGTTGEARWQVEPADVTGVLSVRLGGKNMTFHQRITGRALGTCDDEPARGGAGEGM